MYNIQYYKIRAIKFINQLLIYFRSAATASMQVLCLTRSAECLD